MGSKIGHKKVKIEYYRFGIDTCASWTCITHLFRFGPLEGQGIRKIYLWNCLKGFQFWFKGFIKNANEVADTKKRKWTIILTIVLLATKPIKLICTVIQQGKKSSFSNNIHVFHVIFFTFLLKNETIWRFRIFGSELDTQPL